MVIFPRQIAKWIIIIAAIAGAWYFRGPIMNCFHKSSNFVEQNSGENAIKKQHQQMDKNGDEAMDTERNQLRHTKQ